MQQNNYQRIVRHRRVRAKIHGTDRRPRLAVFRSNRSLYAQLIDDVKRITLASGKADSKNMSSAQKLGKLLADKFKKLGVGNIVFDRGGYKYHGSIRALADALRQGGIKF